MGHWKTTNSFNKHFLRQVTYFNRNDMTAPHPQEPPAANPAPVVADTPQQNNFVLWKRIGVGRNPWRAVPLPKCNPASTNHRQVPLPHPDIIHHKAKAETLMKQIMTEHNQEKITPMHPRPYNKMRNRNLPNGEDSMTTNTDTMDTQSNLQTLQSANKTNIGLDSNESGSCVAVEEVENCTTTKNSVPSQEMESSINNIHVTNWLASHPEKLDSIHSSRPSSPTTTLTTSDMAPNLTMTFDLEDLDASATVTVNGIPATEIKCMI